MNSLNNFFVKSLSLILIFVFNTANAYHIMLDPGHGGMDTGAVRGSTKEADLVLRVAKELQKKLQENTNFQVSMTRETDNMISLPHRVQKAEEAKADLFVSLHANAAGDSRAQGVEFFFQNSLPSDEDSLLLASIENQQLHDKNSSAQNTDPSKKGDVAAIIEDLRKQYRIESSMILTQKLSQTWKSNNSEDRVKVAIKQAPFYVITKTNMPSVLIEVGFITNQREVKKLNSSNYQKEIADRIYSALVSYKEKMDKNSSIRQSAETIQ